jgi:phosphohistidine phosphatase
VIWLLRHAEAEDGTPDAERPLTEHGRANATAVGEAMARMGVNVQRCVTSPKVRARETADLACRALGLEPEEDRRLEGGPFDPREVAGGDEHVLLVGHDPDFSLAVNHLTGAQVRLKKGGLAGIDAGELIALLRPTELEAITS